MSYDNPAAIVTSAAGNQVGVLYDGTNYRLACDVRNGTGATPDQPAQGYGVGSKTIIRPLLNGTAQDLQVNGATTPVTFSYTAGGVNNVIYRIRLLMSVAGMAFNGGSFGGSYLGALGAVFYPGALTKGLAIGVQSGGVKTTLATYFINEDLLWANGGSGTAAGASGAYIYSDLVVNQTLVGGTTDGVFVTVSENLTGNHMNILRCYCYGVSA